MVGNEETKSENYHHNKKKTRRKSRSICNDKVTVKKKSRGALPILNHETGERG